MLKTTVTMLAVILAVGVAACDRHPAPAEGTDNGMAQTGTTDPSTQAADVTNRANTGTTGNGTDATGAGTTAGGTTSSSPGRGGAGGIGGIGGTTAAR